MTVTYSYNNSNFPGDTSYGTNLTNLTRTIEASSISSSTLARLGLKVESNADYTIDVIFESSLSEPDITTLNNIISSYTYQIYPDRVCVIKDVKSPGTNAGTFTSGSWQNRILNTLEGNVNFVTLSNNTFTLEEGNYIVNISAPAYNVRNHQMRLHNITDNTYELGTSAYAITGAVSNSELQTLLTLSYPKTFEVQHSCSLTVTDSGRGLASGFSSEEIYTIVKIQHI